MFEDATVPKLNHEISNYFVDGVILGGSSLAQLQNNMRFIDQGPLDPSMCILSNLKKRIATRIGHNINTKRFDLVNMKISKRFGQKIQPSLV